MIVVGGSPIAIEEKANRHSQNTADVVECAGLYADHSFLKCLNDGDGEKEPAGKSSL